MSHDMVSGHDADDKFCICTNCLRNAGKRSLPAPAVEPAIGVREALEVLATRMFEDSQTYWAGKVSDIAKALQSPTLPPNPKGREQEEKL